MSNDGCNEKKELINEIEFPTITDERGSLVFVEQKNHLPFSLKRIFYIHNIPDNAIRGGHAHRELHQCLVAINGNFDIKLDNGDVVETVNLNDPEKGIHIYPGTWTELKNFSPDSICVVLASEIYNEDDYIRCYDDFLNWKKIQ